MTGFQSCRLWTRANDLWIPWSPRTGGRRSTHLAPRLVRSVWGIFGSNRTTVLYSMIMQPMCKTFQYNGRQHSLSSIHSLTHSFASATQASNHRLCICQIWLTEHISGWVWGLGDEDSILPHPLPSQTLLIYNSSTVYTSTSQLSTLYILNSL